MHLHSLMIGMAFAYTGWWRLHDTNHPSPWSRVTHSLVKTTAVQTLYFPFSDTTLFVDPSTKMAGWSAEPTRVLEDAGVLMIHHQHTGHYYLYHRPALPPSPFIAVFLLLTTILLGETFIFLQHRLLLELLFHNSNHL